MNVYKWYKVSRWFYLHKLTPLAIIMKILIRIIWSAVIPYKASIGKGTIIGNQGLGVVIHKNCVIGENCHISQNVTLGGRGGKGSAPNGVPNLGNNVKIGAGAVVLTDVPDNCTAEGVPAKIIKNTSSEGE